MPNAPRSSRITAASWPPPAASIAASGRRARSRCSSSPPRLEKDEQADVQQALKVIGAQVWNTGTRRPRGDDPRTRMTPGIPDLLAFLPATATRAPQLLAIEMKQTGKTMTEDQHRFAGCCAAVGIAHVAGDAGTVLAWLERFGYLRVTAGARGVAP